MWSCGHSETAFSFVPSLAIQASRGEGFVSLVMEVVG
jgi:hypothetical protein